MVPCMDSRPKVAIKAALPARQGFITTRKSRDTMNVTEETIKSAPSQGSCSSLKESFLLSSHLSKCKSGVPLEREINPPPSTDQDKIKVKYTYIHARTCIHTLPVYLHVHVCLFMLSLCNCGE